MTDQRVAVCLVRREGVVVDGDDHLTRLLEEAGFTQLRRCNRQEGAVPDLALLERRSPTAIYVEAS